MQIWQVASVTLMAFWPLSVGSPAVVLPLAGPKLSQSFAAVVAARIDIVLT
jgi:hypothetical protein